MSNDEGSKNDLLENELLAAIKNVKMASKSLRYLDEKIKNKVLNDLAESLLKNTVEILEENRKDLNLLNESETSSFKDRLTLNSERLQAMSESLISVSRLKDPVGEVVEEKKIQDSLIVKKTRAPLGVIFMIFESRPNVALEAFSLAFKAGNALILRGGKESKHTITLFYKYIRESLLRNKIPENVFYGVTDPNREIVNFLLKQKKWIDVVVPRGGEKLIEFVSEHSHIPVIKNDRGLCHLVIDESANLDMAVSIFKNGKTQRPGVCNAIETVLIHEKISELFLGRLLNEFKNVEFYLDRPLFEMIKNSPKDVFFENAFIAEDKNFHTEYLDLKISIKAFKNLDEALLHIEAHGSKHSEAIVTENESNARRFQNEVDAACVYWNASTRFSDGFQLGLGGELGISTQKLHVRGPVGLNELTSLRWIFDGHGEIRS